jgi:hypothetical protein
MNARRSGDMAEYIEIRVPISTSEETLRKVQRNMLEFVKNNPKIYLPDCTLNIVDVGFTNMMSYRFNIPYKGNWQDGKRLVTRQLWLVELKRIIIELGIKFELPVQPVKIIKKPAEAALFNKAAGV